MKILAVLLFATLYCCSASFAQTTKIEGIITDSVARQGISNAAVLILSPGDSLLLGFTRTSPTGAYTLTVPARANYMLQILHPQFADYVDEVPGGKAAIKIPGINMTGKAQLLQAVILNSSSPIRVKGDTTIFSADSFKVGANANVEELLKKLPGLQVDKDGKITAMGQTVEKVLVDGEEFFGEDPGMAVKNLRADAVKEVQVFDKKSEQAEFTGIDDGKTQKTINLKLKENAKKGYFGKVGLSGGPLAKKGARYNNNLLFSSFKGKRKISGYLLNGNTGQDGLSWQDRQKYGGADDNVEVMDDGGIMISSTNESGFDVYVDPKNGFIRNLNAGLQYNTSFGKSKINITPQYNGQIYDNSVRSYTQQQLDGDSVLNTNSNKNAHVNRYNQVNRVVFDTKIDSLTTLKVTASGSLSNTKNNEYTQSTTTGKTNNLKNNFTRSLNTNNDRTQLFATAVVKHKFAKDRRTLSLTTGFNNESNTGDSYLITETNDFVNNQFLPVNQLFNIDKQQNRYNAKLTYTEPLSKMFALSISHELILDNGNNNQSTMSYSNTTGKYDTKVDSLTNFFDQKIVINQPSLVLSYNAKKIKYNIGSGFGFTKFDFTDKTLNRQYNRDFTNFFPSANFSYNYKANSSIRASYQGRTIQPTLNQLQPLRNINDPFNQYIGNPNLKQSFNNNFSISNNSYNFLKESYYYVYAYGGFTLNSIQSAKTINAATGKTITQPVNTDGNYNAGLSGGTGLKLKKLDMRLNIGPNLNYSQYVQIINGQSSFSKNLNTGINIYLNKTKDKKYDLTASTQLGRNTNKNGQTNTTNSFNTIGANFDGTIYYKKVWNIVLDYEMNARQKTLQARDNLSYQLLNTTLNRTFKNDEYTVYVTVRDVFNQNVGITQNFYGNTYSQTINERLRRFFMLGFTWNFKNKSNATTK